MTHHDPEQIRAFLGYLRRHKYPTLSARQILELRDCDEALNGAIGFTIDDGYLDQAEIAAPIFAEFDCPVTIFLCSGFLDRKVWMWWDRIEYVFDRAPCRDLGLDLDGEKLRLQWDAATGRSVKNAFVEHCKTLGVADRDRLIRELSFSANIEVPETAPQECAPMTWADARRWESQAFTMQLIR